MMDKLRKWLSNAIDSFAGDPPDTDFQRGYLAALKDVQQEAEA